MYAMVNVRSAKLASAVLLISAFAATTNLAFAQQSNSLFPPCTVSAAHYDCSYVSMAQMIGAGLVVGVVAVAVGLGAYGRRYHVAAYA